MRIPPDYFFSFFEKLALVFVATCFIETAQFQIIRFMKSDSFSFELLLDIIRVFKVSVEDNGSTVCRRFKW